MLISIEIILKIREIWILYKEQVNFLGFFVGQNGIRIDSDKIQIIKK